MGVTLDKEISTRFRELRKKRFLSQENLHQEANVSLRTIQNLENHRRSSFSESTLLALCRALGIDYDMLWASDEVWSREVLGEQLVVEQTSILKDSANKRQANAHDFGHTTSAKWRWIYGISGITISMTILVVFLQLHDQMINTEDDLFDPYSKINTQTGRYDWISNDEKLDVYPGFAGDKYWDKTIEGKTAFRALKDVKYKKMIQMGDSIHVEFSWVWYYTSAPRVFISAFAKWNPDEEIRVFQGNLVDQGTQSAEFVVPPPPDLGVFTIRIFYVEAFAPVSSFYGSPLPSLVTSPSSARHVEIMVEVLR